MNYLFSYGTLQLKQVQLNLFGKKLTGTSDILKGYKISTLKISNVKVIKSSGINTHPILEYTNNPNDQVKGTLFEISQAELKQADQYEVSDYQRQQVTFESGKTGFVYLKAGN